MAFNFILPLRVVQFVLALAALIPAAIFVHNDLEGSSEGGFMVFLPVWTFLVLLYLVAAPLWVQSIHNEWVVLGLEVVTTILWLAGFAALASIIPDYFCHDSSLSKSCSALDSAKAAVALGALEFLAFAFSLALVIWNIVKQRRAGADPSVEAGVGVADYNMGPAQGQYQEGALPGQQGSYPQAPPQTMSQTGPGYPV